MALSNDFKAGIESGVYRLGELIEPKTFRKLAIDESGKVLSEMYTVSGRKIKLLDLREVMLKEHVARGLVRAIDVDARKMSDDKIRQLLSELDIPAPSSSSGLSLQEYLNEKITERCLMIWIDHASVLSHGHLLGTVKTIYSKRFFYTTHEILIRTGNKLNETKLSKLCGNQMFIHHMQD